MTPITCRTTGTFSGIVAMLGSAHTNEAMPLGLADYKIFSTERMSVFAMGFRSLWVFCSMFFPGNWLQMAWIAAMPVFADVMQYCFGWKFTNQDKVNNAMCSIGSFVPGNPAIPILNCTFPKPASTWIENNFVENSFRQHERRVSQSPSPK